MVYAFRGSIEDEGSHAFMLQGLQSSARYAIKFNDHSGEDRTVTGSDLLQHGLQVSLPLPNSSEIVFVEER